MQKVELDGAVIETTPRTRKPRTRKPAPPAPVIETPQAPRKPRQPKAKSDHLARWSHAYVFIAAGMSMALNAIANGQHAPNGTDGAPDMRLAAWTMGALIPVLVLLLGKVAGLLWKRDQRTFALTTGGIGVVVLLLSVFHCAESIGMLTGSHWLLAGALAIGIDAGMVACEISATIAD